MKKAKRNKAIRNKAIRNKEVRNKQSATMSQPETLFKFQTVCARSLGNLNESQIYFSNPSQFNDPFDCQIPITYELRGNEIAKLKDYLICEAENKHSESYLSAKICGLVRSGVNPTFSLGDELRRAKPSYIIEMFSEATNGMQENLRDIGVSCFSDNINSILMWSHYADNHKGFCIELQAKDPVFHGTHKVIYQEEKPIMNPYEVFTMDFTHLREMTYIKSSEWSYEREYRILRDLNGQVERYNIESLKAIYFGCCASRSDICLIMRIVSGQSKKTKFYQMIKSKSSFKLTSRLINPSEYNYA